MYEKQQARELHAISQQHSIEGAAFKDFFDKTPFLLNDMAEEKQKTQTPREFADKIWGTEGMSDNSLSDFTIPLSTAIGMIENYCKPKNEAIEKAIEVIDQYYVDGGHFYGDGINQARKLLNEAS